MECAIIIFLSVILVLQVVILLGAVKLRKQKEEEYWKDFEHKNLVLRTFKNEDEYMAVRDIPTHKRLEDGELNMNYKWILFEK